MNTPEVTYIIKTFERPKCLRRLLKSMSNFKIENPILIADDSMQPIGKPFYNEFKSLNLKYWHLPFDSGLSFGRNFLVKKVQTNFFILASSEKYVGSFRHG